MAKRKNSTALFEVMREAQRKTLERQGITLKGSEPPPKADPSPPTPPPKPARSYAPKAGQSQFKPLATPAIVTMTKRWFNALMEKKARPESVEQEESALDPNDPTAGMTAQSLASRTERSNGKARAPETIETPVKAAEPVRTPVPVAAPVSQDAFEDETDESAAVTPAARTAVAPLPPKNANQVAIDRNMQQVTVKVRFNTIIIGAVAAMVVIGLAYIVGKKAGTPNGPTARTPSSTEIRNGNVQPGVLDPRTQQQQRALPPADANVAGARIPADTSASISPAPLTGAMVSTTRGSFHDVPIINGLAERVNGLNYCVIQTYSHSQQEWAMQVRDYLNSAGIPCTIEIGRRSLGNTRSGDYVIVGTRGFAPGYGDFAGYKQYEETIARAGAAFPDKSIFKRPETFMVKWENQ